MGYEGAGAALQSGDKTGDAAWSGRTGTRLPARVGQRGRSCTAGAPPDHALLAGVVQSHEELRLLPDVADEVAHAEVEAVRG